MKSKANTQADSLFDLNTMIVMNLYYDSDDIPVFLLHETNFELELNRSPDEI